MQLSLLTEEPATHMTKISVFKNILHDAWLDYHGPYSGRPPTEDEARQELYAELDNYFKNEVHGDWINTFKPLALSWIINTNSVISHIQQVTESFNDTTSSDERAHYQAFLELAEWLKDYA